MHSLFTFKIAKAKKVSFSREIVSDFTLFYGLAPSHQESATNGTSTHQYPKKWGRIRYP